jgi:hypothetical protein
MHHQRFQLGPENEFAGVEEGVVQRLDAKAVAHHEQRFLRAVPQREREHAAKAVDAGFAPGFPGVDDDFGVGMGAEGVAERFELGHQFLEVVDLAVEHHDDRAVFVEQRLLAGGEVDDRQPPVPEAHARFQMQAAFVRAAMELGFMRCSRSRDAAENAGYAAHRVRVGLRGVAAGIVRKCRLCPHMHGLGAAPTRGAGALPEPLKGRAGCVGCWDATGWGCRGAICKTAEG